MFSCFKLNLLGRNNKMSVTYPVIYNNTFLTWNKQSEINLPLGSTVLALDVRQTAL